MSHIRSICVTKKSSVIGSFPASTGWLWVGGCVFLGLPKLFLPTGWEVLTDGKGVRRTWQERWDGCWEGRSGLAVPGEGGRPEESPQEGAGLLEKGISWLLFVLYVLYLLSKESLPLFSVCKSPFQTRKGNKKQIIFMSHKIVLKPKSICFTKSTFLS